MEQNLKNWCSLGDPGDPSSILPVSSDGADTKKVAYGYLRIVKGRIRVGSDGNHLKSDSDSEKVGYFSRISDT